MQKSLTLLVVTCLAAPGIAGAQIDIASVTVPPAPAPLRLFTDTVPEPGGRSTVSITSSSWYEAPRGGNEIPRWAIGQTVTANTPRGVALSAGFFARRADPLPLFLSHGVTPDTLRTVSNGVTDPASHRLNLDLKFGVSKLVRDGPQLKINAMGDVFIPLKGSSSLSPAFGTSPAFRLGIKTAF
jgi:hypothetical protein